MIESILQVRALNPKAVILACAPSNHASDILLQRLIGKVENRHMLRLICSSFAGCPSQSDLKNYQVIVCTYLSSAILNALPPGHLTHIFLDEAGQATERETMIPIANFAHSDTVVVLAGDHCQLGPLIRSKLARAFRLDDSLMQRLITLAGGEQVYSSGLVTKLVKNYRPF